MKKEKQLNQNKYLVYIPQGYSGRFQEHEKIGGFTNNFGPCNIFVIKGKNRFVLIHVDELACFAFSAIKAEIKSIFCVLLYKKSV